MKYKKEIKAAFIGVLSIVTFLGLINFIKGKNLFSQGITLYAIYENVSGLEVSRPVVINGFQVGKVEKISFHPNLSGKLIVQMRINSEFKFSKLTTAIIAETGLVTGPQIELNISKEGPLAKDGDMINSKQSSSAFNVLLEKSGPISNQFENVLINMNKALESINSLASGEKNQISKLFKGLNDNLNSLKSVLFSITKATNSTKEMVESYKKIADSFSKKGIEKIALNMGNSLELFQKILSDLDKGKGTLGMLAKDQELYKELTGAFKETKFLVEDLRLHPKRYFHFSVFGKKNAPYKIKPTN